MIIRNCERIHTVLYAWYSNDKDNQSNDLFKFEQAHAYCSFAYVYTHVCKKNAKAQF